MGSCCRSRTNKLKIWFICLSIHNISIMNIEWHAAYLPDDKKFNRPEEMVRGLVSQICDDLMLNRWIPWL